MSDKKLFENLKQSLKEAIEFEKGNKEVATTVYKSKQKPEIINYIEDLHQDFGYMLGNLTGYVCDGWMQLIRDMLQEIDALHYGTGEHPVFTVINESFGRLQVYGYDVNDETQKIIDRYVALSAEICMN